MIISPYPLKDIDHLSASAMTNYCGMCEANRAYRGNFIGVPSVSVPYAAAHGTVIHLMAQRLAKMAWTKVKQTGRPISDFDLKRLAKTVRYGVILVEDVLREKHSARGESAPMEPIRWMTQAERAAKTEAEYEEFIEKKIEEGKRRAFNSLYSLVLEYTEPLPFTDMAFEFNFNRYNLLIGVPNSEWRVRFEGQIDRIRYAPGFYDLTDYKTGYVISDYQKRQKLAEDIQMTVYHYVMTKLTGRPPRDMYIQPLDIPTAFRKEHGAKTLALKRIPVPCRRSIHVEDLDRLVSDIRQMVYMVVHANSFSLKQREDWRPSSDFAGKLALEDNVVQGRFVPRIGSWCPKVCQYYELCLVDHREDWEEYRLKHGNDLYEPAEPAVQVSRPERAESEQGMLFVRGPKRSPYMSKVRRLRRREMVASGDFLPRTRLRGIPTPSIKGSLANDCQRFLTALGPCPCVEFKLTPRWFVENVGLIAAKSVSVGELAQYCPCPDCPRRKVE
ncbi:MAG: PD-(D/E)XK nuclease family protein [Acidobacteriaceae bacterium]